MYINYLARSNVTLSDKTVVEGCLGTVAYQNAEIAWCALYTDHGTEVHYYDSQWDNCLDETNKRVVTLALQSKDSKFGASRLHVPNISSSLFVLLQKSTFTGVEEFRETVSELVKKSNHRHSSVKDTLENGKDVTTMSTERNGVFITIPAKISAKQESVRNFEVAREGEDSLKLAEVTLPKGTEINGQ